MTIQIAKTDCAFEVEPFRAPFGFKGNYLSGQWQCAALMRSAAGHEGLGVGVLSPLWSDAELFAAHPESATGGMMFLMMEHALKAAQGRRFETPLDLLDQLLPLTYEYGKKITGKADLRLTFALNALVAVDNAAWMLYSRETGTTIFDDLLPSEFRPALAHRHEKIACIPLFSYGVSIEEIMKAVAEGFFFAKIKVGADPDKDGNYDKMLAWDQARLSTIHEQLKDRPIPWTAKGWIPYYLDANGRYDSKDRLKRLLDHADRIGALERIVIFEEPFAEEYTVEVGDLPVRIAADESAHAAEDARRRIELGYGAIALKPIAKTMSMSLRIAKLAHAASVPCFCADLTVCPLLVDWNKVVAARLPPLPGMKIGVLESNGHQNYLEWTRMCSYHPAAGAAWTTPHEGLFQLDAEFWRRSGGILEMPEHYRKLMK
jgi:L-alanine-DL-glutamate epimerase-like enolase superfamily enzyme